MGESIREQLEAALHAGGHDLALQLVTDNPLTELVLTGEDFSNALQLAVSAGKTEICRVMIEKCNFSRDQIDHGLANTKALLNQHETLTLMIEQHPSLEVLNGILREYQWTFLAQRDFSPEDFRGDGGVELIDPMRGLELLINAGAREQPFERDTLLTKMLNAGGQDLFERYYDREALITILQLAPRNREQVIFAWALGQAATFTQDEIFALLVGCALGVKHDSARFTALFDEYLPKLSNINMAFQTYRYLIDEVARDNNLGFIQKVLERGANVNTPSQNILMPAIQANALEISEVFLQAGADPNANDGAAITLAVQNDQLEMVKLLLRYGAKAATSKNRAMKYAKANRNTAMIELLATAGAKKTSDEPYRFGLETATMAELWPAWLRYCQEFVLENAAPFVPVPAEELEAFVQTVEARDGLKVPEELRIIYQHCNGGEQLMFGLKLFSPQEVLAEGAFWRDLSRDFVGKPENAQNNYPVYPPNTIKKQYINPCWLPFASDGTANVLSIDFDPDLEGTSGQIINSGRDQWERFRCANNILELTRKAMRRIEANLSENNADGFFYLIKNGQGFLGDVLQLVKTNAW
jgi:cell wall assembly regulator SMI1